MKTQRLGAALGRNRRKSGQLKLAGKAATVAFFANREHVMNVPLFLPPL
jgi:hypothetical protein